MNKLSNQSKVVLPEPTKANPYVQIEFIFMRVADTKENQNTRNNYLGAMRFYKTFLKSTNNYDNSLKTDNRFYLQKHWNEFALVNVRNYMDATNKRNNEGYLTSHTLVGYFSAIRIVFQEAISMGLFKTDAFIDVAFGQVVRETETNIAYSVLEFDQIKVALKEELNYVYKIYRKDGYKFTGVGEDPRNRPIGDRNAKWNLIENMRWYFENVLDFDPIIGISENKINHKMYVEYAPTKYFNEIGGLRGIYRLWGVTPFIDADVIMPLVIQLAIQTGLNVESLLELEIDCYEESSPLTGVPSIKYFKRRSGGDKEMHINTNPINDNVTLKNFRQHQAKLIGNTIKIVLALTSDIRINLPTEIKRKLFIMQSTSQKTLGEIKQVNSSITSNWYSKFVNKYNLKSDDGRRLSFNLRRFRSTKITDMVEKGIDIFELQHEMGHSSVQTTMNYLSKNKLHISAREKVSSALNQIFENKSWAESEKPNYATDQSSNNQNVIYKGILCDCKNPFDPPEDVKKLKTYQEGQPCTRMNMCMFCNNVIIFKRDLPLIWMYKKQIEVALDRVTDQLPNQQEYLKSLDIIYALFDEEQSEFTKEDIEWAISVSENLDELVDPVTYIPIAEEEVVT